MSSFKNCKGITTALNIYHAGYQAEKINRGSYSMIIADDSQLKSVTDQYPDMETGTCLSFPFGGMTTAVKIELMKRAAAVNCRNIFVIPGQTSIKGEGPLITELYALKENIDAESTLIPVLPVSDISFQELEYSCRQVHTLGITCLGLSLCSGEEPITSDYIDFIVEYITRKFNFKLILEFESAKLAGHYRKQNDFNVIIRNEA